jgi:hypothetical protein
MANGDISAPGEPDAAELAARQAIETDADDWRGHEALARALLAQKQVQQAIVAARRAVALAPDEPEARLTLADSLLAVTPRRTRTRAAARAEIDQAELLGVDPGDLADRRKQPKGLGFWIFYWTFFQVFIAFGANGFAGTIGRAVAWPAYFVFIAAIVVFSTRPPGQPLRQTLDTKRKISRKRLATDELVAQRAPAATAVLAFLVLPTAFLAIPGADGNAPPLALAWLTLVGIPLVGLATWIGIDRWLFPGTVTRVPRHDPFTAFSVVITFVLATNTSVIAVRKVQSSGLWFTLFLVQMAWLLTSVICGVKLTSRRKKAAS